MKALNEDLKNNTENIQKQAALSQQTINDLTKALKAQDLKMDTIKMNTDQVLEDSVTKIAQHTTNLKNLADNSADTQKLITIIREGVTKLNNRVETKLRYPGGTHPLANGPQITREQKNVMVTELMKKYEQQAASMEIMQQMLKEIITGIL